MAEAEGQPGWEYKPGQTVDPGVVAQTPDFSVTAAATEQPGGLNVATNAAADGFSWQAEEFADHHRPAVWYLGLLLATAVIAAAIYLVTKDYISTGTVIVLGIVVLVASSRKPRTIDCTVSSSGLQIGTRRHGFGQFKSFTIMREIESPTLEFLPIKKLMPPVTIHFNVQDEKQITDIIGNYLPYEERAMHSIDRLAHRLKI